MGKDDDGIPVLGAGAVERGVHALHRAGVDTGRAQEPGGMVGGVPARPRSDEHQALALDPARRGLDRRTIRERES